MCLKNETLSWVLIAPARMSFAATPGVSRGWLQRTPERGRAPERGNCRDLNLLRIGTGAADLTRLAAAARSQSRRSLLIPSVAVEGGQSVGRTDCGRPARPGSARGGTSSWC